MSNDRYLVTARKYRPATFGELVSQEHVSDTLQNAIKLDRLAHAYLFSGPRGVGKTTAARILAKAINCKTPLAERDNAEPCRACESCRSFEEGRSMNVIEIDAASNNKVDDIRDLRETVRVPPQGAKKKIYILDEVHMLSQGAFNALLKTLEEPPPHVLFIFATTEPHKVLPTILSRCQRFDFRRIAVDEIVGRLREICRAETIEADDESLMLIARRGDGALRDALSIFDQAVSLCGEHLRYAELRDALGVVDADLFFETTDHVRTRNSGGMLMLVDTLVRRGYDLQEYLAGLGEHLRNLLVVATTRQADLIEATDAVRARYTEAAQAFAEPDLLRLLMIAGDTEDALKNASQPRLKLELALLKMAALERAGDLAAAIQKIERLERMAREGTLPGASLESPVPAATSEPTADYAAPPPRPTAAPAAPPPPADPGPPAPPTAPPARSAAERPSPPPADPPAPAPPAAHEAPPSSPPRDEPPPRRDDEPPAPPPAAPSLGGGLFGKPALNRPAPPAEGEANASPPSPKASLHVTAPTLDASTVATLAQPGVDMHFGVPLGRVRDVWDAAVQEMKGSSVRLGAMLQQATPSAVARGVLQVSVPDTFFEQQLRDHRQALADTLARHIGEDTLPLEFVVQAPVLSGDGAETPATVDPFEHIKKMRHEHPLVRALFERFGGEIVYERG